MADLGQVKIDFKCAECGLNPYPFDEGLTDGDHVICKGCGADFGTKGEIMARAKREAADSLGKAFVKQIKDRPGSRWR